MSEVPVKMKALVAYTQTDYRYLEDYPVPGCGDDDIIIKTEACGVCVGDLKCRQGAGRYWGNEKEEPWVRPPFIPGHEFLGHIVQLGKNVEGYAIGERVTADQIVPCGKCKFCRSGRYWLCEPHYMFGYQKENNGGMAEYMRFPKTAVVHKIPEELPVEKALLIEPYSCAKHCVDRAQITSDDVIVISGAGTLGLGMITYASHLNAEKLIVLDLNDARLQKALDFGADMVINPAKEDAISKIRELTDGYGCDIYIEATGHSSSVEQGLAMLRKQGRFIEFGVFAEKTTVDWSVIGDGKELDVLGSHISPYCYPYVIKHLASGDLKTDGVVSSIYRLSQWEEAFDKATGKDGDFKVAFLFN